MNILTHSSMTTFKNCRKRYDYRYNMELVPVKRKASLELGTAVHKGLELYYSGQEIDSSIQGAIELLNDVNPSFWNQEDFDRQTAQKAICEGMLRGYFQYFNDIDCFEEIRPELEFLVPIINPATGKASRNYQHAGKIDGLFKKDGQWWLREFKTTSQLDKSYLDRLKLDTQITSYIEAEQNLLGEPIVGVIYTVIRKPSIKQKQDESLAQFCERVIVDYQSIEIDKKTGNPRNQFYFYQEEIFRTQADFDEWRYERWDIAKDIHEAKLTGRWYRNTAYCGEYGGCPYLPLCTKGAEMAFLYQQEPAHRELTIGKEQEHVSTAA